MKTIIFLMAILLLPIDASSTSLDTIKQELYDCFDKKESQICHQEADEKRIQYLIKNFDEILEEANKDFTFQDKPIHPGLVKEFSSWVSDAGNSTTISVDVSARHRNEYDEDTVEIEKKGVVSIKLEGGGYFNYKHLGRLLNGLHVLLVSESGGGSGIFQNLFFVEFSKGRAYSDDGVKYPRLLLSIVRTHGLGDRVNADIELEGDRVNINGKKISFEYKFD